MTLLDDLAAKHNTDKGHANTRGLAPKGYTTAYHGLLSGKRQRKLTVLEIGVGSGASLEMWAEYLPKAEIHGVDTGDRYVPDDPRIVVHRGDQTDETFLADLAQRHGPFDFIVDDGGHHMHQHRISFDALFPHVVPGGFYAIEDLHTAYDARYGGGFGAEESTVERVKRLMDSIHGKGDEPVPAPIESVTFWKRLVVVVRGE